MTGETLFQYIQRVQFDKAAFLLLANTKDSITQIALECGFSNQASFAKAFKKHFNISASQFRIKHSDLLKSNMGKVSNEIMQYNNVITDKQCCVRQISCTGIPYIVKVKEISDISVVYIRHTGPYKKDVALFENLFKKLSKWADERNLINTNETKWITLFCTVWRP